MINNGLAANFNKFVGDSVGDKKDKGLDILPNPLKSLVADGRLERPAFGFLIGRKKQADRENLTPISPKVGHGWDKMSYIHKKGLACNRLTP
jgi:hypothetical protein